MDSDSACVLLCVFVALPVLAVMIAKRGGVLSAFAAAP